MKTKSYKEVCKISLREAKIIADYLNTSDEDEYLSEDKTIIHTVYFPNGNQMNIRCCGVGYGPAFAEAVLFDKNSNQVVYSEPKDKFLGTWTLKHNDISYIAVVKTFGGGGA